MVIFHSFNNNNAGLNVKFFVWRKIQLQNGTTIFELHLLIRLSHSYATKMCFVSCVNLHVKMSREKKTFFVMVWNWWKNDEYFCDYFHACTMNLLIIFFQGAKINLTRQKATMGNLSKAMSGLGQVISSFMLLCQTSRHQTVEYTDTEKFENHFME